jgi:hypothetical protein
MKLHEASIADIIKANKADSFFFDVRLFLFDSVVLKLF